MTPHISRGANPFFLPKLWKKIFFKFQIENSNENANTLKFKNTSFVIGLETHTLES